MSKIGLAAASVIAVAPLSGTPAFAEEIPFMAMLSAAEEVPPTTSGGTGSAAITFNTDTKLLSWTIDFSGLTGPVIAAHFHGPAAMGENADVQVPIEDLESPSEGTAPLTDEQAAQLADGKWYVNLHTDANPDGEIRGQVTKGSM